MFDLIIQNVRVIDGTASPWYRADLGIIDGRIAKIGRLQRAEARERVDGEDRYLTPGFIDIHSHSDTTLLTYPQAESRILQGVTTEIGGNCGMSVAPVNHEKRKLLRDYMGNMDFDWQTIGQFLDRVEAAGSSVNFGTAVGHGTLRLAAMGFDNRRPEPEEMEDMKASLRQALEDGAFCMSSGLIYPPGCYADTDELAELAAELPPYGAFYETHMRDEGLHMVEAVKESLEIGRRSGAPLHISHHKETRRTHWRVSCKASVAMIQRAREEGMDVTADQYPYSASATTLDCNVPLWGYEGGVEKMLERLQNPEIREKLRAECAAEHLGRWDGICVSSVQSEKNQWTVGKSIEEIAKIRGVEPTEACFDLIVEERARVGEIHYSMCEEDIEHIMSQSFVMTGSDGQAASLDYPNLPHPRSYGTFPRVIAHYCRERRLFSLEQAIHKMTGMPAARLQLADRGLIKEGMWADLVLFDFDEIQDTPTFSQPKQGCAGIQRVYVNGVLTAKDGVHTGAKAGTVLRKNINV